MQGRSQSSKADPTAMSASRKSNIRRLEERRTDQHAAMPRKKKAIILSQPVKAGLKAIKVRLDARTIITVASNKALEIWRSRYPKLEVIG